MAPTLDCDGWQLESGLEYHAAAPQTFHIPDERVRSRLVPSSDAKLIFSLRKPDGGVVVERMWVRITGYTDTGYVGELNNVPKTAGVSLALGDKVEFHPDHVIDALPPENWDPVTKTYRET